MADAIRKKLAIIDGKSVFYRGYYAMPNLSTADGTPTGGVYGFAAMSLELIKKLKPDYVAVAWDKPKTNIRSRLAIYPQYKAGRKAAPPDFYAQIPILHDLLKAFSWPLYEYDDYEADDIMCTLAKNAHKQGLETMLITSDLDALQCIDEHTHVYVLKKGFSNIERFDIEHFEEKHGIKIDQFLDLKSLKGDSSDNIPGVPGIGEKTAVQLLQQYETLDGIYENLGLLKDSLRLKLESGKESALMSKKIARLFDDAPVPLDLEGMDVRDLDVGKLKSILQTLEFRSLLRNLPDYMQVVSGNNLQTESVKLNIREVEDLKTVLIDSDEKLESLNLDGNETVIHSLSAGTHGKEPQVLILADSQTAYVINMAKISKKSIVTNFPTIKSLVGYDTKASLKVLLELGIDLPRVSHDVLVGGFLINSIRREHTLTELAFSDLGYEGANLDNMPPEELMEKAGTVAAVILAIKNFQAESMSELTKMIQLTEQVEWPVIPVLARMEWQGIGLNKPYLSDMSVELTDKISDIEQTIYGFADQEFNISSPSQLSDILFDKLNLPTSVSKKGKAGHFSTATDVLQKLKGLHPIVESIEQYREFTKLKSTYVDTLPKQTDENSRVHTTFNLTIAATGRLSSVDPNLQNIPVRTEVGKKIRTAFVAKPGFVFVSADYSQFELRLAAALSSDQDMIDAFNNDQDIHQLTAAAVLNIKPEEVTKDMRYRAKAVNFGILYGQGPHGLAAGTGMGFGEAKDFITKYFMIRPKLKEYLDSLREQAKNKGFVETLLGRRRPTPDAQSSNHMVREGALRAAVNMPIQGTAADLTKLAMVAVDGKFKAEGIKFKEEPRQLLQIHDSIMVECRKEDAEVVSKIMKETMENIYKLPVKLKADISVGNNWGEL
ncbi:DNA polymerase I [Candidatus Saccharibacteria bacterium]|nr:DNA polymerase I [Candidatus Saccharibacteria bacterium]